MDLWFSKCGPLMRISASPGTAPKILIPALTSHLLNWKLCGWGLPVGVLISPPGNSDVL